MKKDPDTKKNVVQELKTVKSVMSTLFKDINAFNNEKDLDEKTCLKLRKHLNDPKRELDKVT